MCIHIWTEEIVCLLLPVIYRTSRERLHVRQSWAALSLLISCKIRRNIYPHIKLTDSCQEGKSLLTRLFFSGSTLSYYISLCVHSPLVHPLQSYVSWSKRKKRAARSVTFLSTLSAWPRRPWHRDQTVQSCFFFLLFASSEILYLTHLSDISWC